MNFGDNFSMQELEDLAALQELNEQANYMVMKLVAIK